MIRKVTGVDLSALPFTNDEVREAIFDLEEQLKSGMMQNDKSPDMTQRKWKNRQVLIIWDPNINENYGM